MTIAVIITTLTAKLFEAEERRLASAIVSLNQRNKRLFDRKVDGFLHSGIFYLPKDASLLGGPGQTKTPLHLSLHGEMETFLKDRKAVGDEHKLISQVLFTVLVPCRSAQHIRNALPECLVGYLPNIAVLSRTDEAAYTIQDKPRALRQYEKALPKMEVYSATQYLY
jgi:hypothetical protein